LRPFPTKLSCHSFRGMSRGFGLVTVLIVLLLGGALVGAALYVAENTALTGRMAAEYGEMFNAAQYGLEVGKNWIATRIKDARLHGRPLPRWSASDDVLVWEASGGHREKLLAFYSYDVAGVFPTKPVFSEDIVFESGYVPRLEGVFSLHVAVFDVRYEVRSDFSYDPLVPVRLTIRTNKESVRKKQSYSEEDREIGAYVVRSTLFKDGVKRKVLEQAFIEAR
jgi:hypothetical protein